MTPMDAGWALLALFVVSWTAAAVWAGAAVRRLPPREQWPLYAAGIAAMGFMAVASGAWPQMNQRLWDPVEWLDWFFVALCALGIAFCWWARVHLGRLWSGGIVLREGHRVVDTGPYAWVRHPIYSGAFLIVIALAALRARPGAFLFALMVVVFFSCKARLEERLLERELGEEYARYRARVPMLVPRPWGAPTRSA